MAEVNLGEAIASGTNRQPERDMPITRGLQMQEQVAFRDNQAELKREAELNRRREMGAKMIGSFDPKKWHNPEYGKEFGTYLQSKTPELLDAWRKDPLEFQRKSDEVKYQLGKLQAIDNDEHEIFGVEKKGSISRPIVRKVFEKGGMPAVNEWNKRYWFSPLTFTNPNSGYMTVNDVYAKNIDAVMDENTKKVLGKDYKQVGKLGVNPLFEMDITSPDFLEKKEAIVGNLLMDKDFEKAVLYNPDFIDYYDKKLEENGLDPYQPNEEFLNKAYTDFVTDRFTSRIIPKQRMGGTPAKPRTNNGGFRYNSNGSWEMGGFTYIPVSGKPNTYKVGTPKTGDSHPSFTGLDGKRRKITNKILNAEISYLGDNMFRVSGPEVGAEASAKDIVLDVDISDLKTTLSPITDLELKQQFGYKPSEKPNPTNKPTKKKKLY
jgi:hypothetical protein